MYGPRSSYASDDVAQWDQDAKDEQFRAQLIAALKHPEVLRALEEAVQAAHVAVVASSGPGKTVVKP